MHNEYVYYIYTHIYAEYSIYVVLFLFSSIIHRNKMKLLFFFSSLKAQFNRDRLGGQGRRYHDR